MLEDSFRTWLGKNWITLLLCVHAYFVIRVGWKITMVLLGFYSRVVLGPLA